ESDDEPRQRGKRGPKSATRDHYWPPVSVTTNGNKRWSFKCRHVGCSASVTFARTVGKTDLFGDQKPAPSLGNLATHLNKDHKGASPPSDVQPGQVRNVSAASGKIMEEYLLEGSLNPMINSTQANFLRIFAAWIIEDDLAFTTGETNGINRLFKFLHTRYQLPSDSTAIDSWVFEREELRPLLISTEQWAFLEAVANILEVFTQVTLQMSRSSTPTLPWVLPMYEMMLKHLRKWQADDNSLRSLRDAASAGLGKLEVYYSKARGCQLNVIATCMCITLPIFSALTTYVSTPPNPRDEVVP
ncbi:hypothetical protein DFH09DRAFT_938405, partial [Mycena vulgaris]